MVEHQLVFICIIIICLTGELMRLVNETLSDKNEIKSLVDRVQNLESLTIPHFQSFNAMMSASPILHNYRLPYGYTPISSRAPVDKLPTPDFPGEKLVSVNLNDYLYLISQVKSTQQLT